MKLVYYASTFLAGMALGAYLGVQAFVVFAGQGIPPERRSLR